MNDKHDKAHFLCYDVEIHVCNLAKSIEHAEYAKVIPFFIVT